MIIQTIKTEKITVGSPPLTSILDHSIRSLSEASICIITSKIVSICEGRVVRIGDAEKETLVEQESQYFIPPEKSKYNISLTITRNLLIPTAGIDESNGDGYYVLWPKDPQQTAVAVRSYLAHRFGLTRVGVLITDSKTTPMRLGTTGVSLAYSGFSSLNNYIDTPDIFGRKLKVTKANVADGLAAAAVLAMGEGNEQTPIAIATDVPFIRFDERHPTEQELRELEIPMTEDIYGPLIQSAPWQKGKG